ncbi:MAG: hypothetical protein ABI760_25195 [Ferruginibacter sp.]
MKRTILFSGLRNYYLMHSKMFSTMLFTYEDNNGKFKRWSMSGQPHNEQVQLLNAELEKRFPGKSLNNLSQKEAFKIMKKMNRILLAATLVPIIFLIAVGIIALIIMFS